MYVHGLSSSGSSHTVETLRQYLPTDTIISPDLPLPPQEALDLLLNVVHSEQVDLVIGTSMGGMFAQKLRGVKKILVNPAFHVSDFMRERLGVQPFFNPRQDGATHFEITPALCDDYAKLEKSQFEHVDEEEKELTLGLFGREDELINCRDEFHQYYPHIYYFHGGHRLNEEIIKMHVLPLVDSFRP